jgi:hypothetical protein
MGTRWSDTLALVDRPTGDRRRFAEGALDHRSLPLPLKWQREQNMGHDSSVVVGVIDTLDVDGKGQKVLAGGWFFDDLDPEFERLSADVREALMLATEGVIGPSVDLEPDFDVAVVKAGTDEPLEFEELMELGEDEQIEMLFTRAKIMGATLVSGPAFEHSSTDFKVFADDTSEDDDAKCPEGKVWDPETEKCVDAPADDDEMSAQALVASVIGSTSLPVGDRDRDWSGGGATSRMFDAATGEGGKVNVAQVSRGFLYRDPDADPQTKAAYKLPFADVIDGTLTIVPKGVAAVAGGRGVGAASIPENEKATIRRKTCTLYGKVRSRFSDWPECPFDSSKASAMVASFGQHPEDYKVPAATMFDNPGLAEPTGLTWTDEGHVFGHIALNASCHSGFPDVCITPPESKSDYSWFHRYPIETDDGIIWAGRIIAGGRHADLSKAFDRAVDHYDRLTTAAYVVAGTDEFGIWISGALQPNLPDHVMSILGRRKPSGDWRETSDGLELIEVLALMPGPRELSEPGYPIETHVTNGRQTALVACLGPVSRETSQAPGAPAEIDYSRLGASIVATMREIERTEARREELAAAIRATADEQVAQARVRLAESLEV